VGLIALFKKQLLTGVLGIVLSGAGIFTNAMLWTMVLCLANPALPQCKPTPGTPGTATEQPAELPDTQAIAPAPALPIDPNAQAPAAEQPAAAAPTAPVNAPAEAPAEAPAMPDAGQAAPAAPAAEAPAMVAPAAQQPAAQPETAPAPAAAVPSEAPAQPATQPAAPAQQ
jgi:hypothetical protein